MTHHDLECTVPGRQTDGVEPCAAALVLLPTMLRTLLQPFDALRHAHAVAVSTGVLPRSLLANGNVERWLIALETLALGPWARRR